MVIVGEVEKATKDDAGNLTRESVKMFVGAHDLRRAFCSRWAKRVMPAVLQKLARHAHISTTMSFYVCISADEVAADLWTHYGATVVGVGNTFSNTGQKQHNDKRTKNRAKSLL